MSERRTASFAARLLDWYDRGQRHLPWRDVADAWGVWVSEVMLQQTRAATVAESWRRFVRQFPEPAAWARADDDTLLAAWRGLGYYRRARLLRDGARAVVERHGGRVPDRPDALRALPGVGDYTAGAIASIAFGVPVPAVDGNVLRVVARHTAERGDISRADTVRRVADAVRARLDARRPGDFNQALMDLGALLCTPRRPACDECPVADDCAARRADLVDAIPLRRARRTPVAVTARALWIELARGRIAALRTAAGAVNEGQLELPGPGVLASIEDAGTIAARTAERCGGRYAVGDELARIRHAITHHRITLVVHAAKTIGRPARALLAVAPDDPRWSTPARKALAAIADPNVRARGGRTHAT